MTLEEEDQTRDGATLDKVVMMMDGSGWDFEMFRKWN